jgi:hypothetical protein
MQTPKNPLLCKTFTETAFGDPPAFLPEYFSNIGMTTFSVVVGTTVLFTTVL